MPHDSASDLANGFIGTMLQDLEMTTNEENFSEGRDVPDVDLGQEDIDPDARRAIARFCQDFYIANEAHIHAPDACKRQGTGESVAALAGHDLYMTRVGHGVGFWDSTCWDETHGGAMDEYTQAMGHFEPYLGDDGKVYI